MLLSVFGFSAAPSSAGAASSHPVINLELKDLSGKSRSLQALRGKVVVLNFWATWCGPCVAELPELVELAERYREAGLVVVAASVDDPGNHDDVEAFARQKAKGLQVWVGASGSDMAALGLGDAVPATLLIDRSGRVIEKVTGGISRGELDSVVEKLLQQPEGSPDQPDAEPDKPRRRRDPDAMPRLPQAFLGSGGDARCGV